MVEHSFIPHAVDSVALLSAEHGKAGESFSPYIYEHALELLAL